jgi:hypothetical protein
VHVVLLARALALLASLSLASLSLAACATHPASDGRWRTDDRTLALARERAEAMGGHGIPGGILVGIAEHARLEIQGTQARISFTGERAPAGRDYAVAEPAPGELRLTATTENRDLPERLTLQCVPPDADPCTSLRLVAYDDTVLPDAPAITLARGE